jgi:hypothetical protein
VEEEIETPVSIPEVQKNVHRWKMEYIYIGLIILVGLMVMFFMNKKARTYPRTSSG